MLLNQKKSHPLYKVLSKDTIELEIIPYIPVYKRTDQKLIYPVEMQMVVTQQPFEVVKQLVIRVGKNGKQPMLYICLIETVCP